MATSYRIERLNKEFLRIIADLIHTRIKNDLAKDAILTQVDCSKDLGHAKVFYTVLDKERLKDIEEALRQTAGVLRGYLGKEMFLRQIPELHFVYDDSEQKARELDALLDSISTGKKGKSLRDDTAKDN